MKINPLHFQHDSAIEKAFAAASGGYRMCQGQNGTWYAVFRNEMDRVEYEINNDHFDGCNLARFDYEHDAYNAFIIGTLH